VYDAGVSERRLAGGLRVVEMPMPGRLASSVALAFPAGSRHERPGELGVGHLLEHLAFKGTERHRTARELNRAAERLGTELHGSTSTDYVEFATEVRAPALMGALELITDLAGRPLLAEEHLETERSIILQEIADDRENPGSRADDRLRAALFGAHRLGCDIAGTPADVRGLTQAEVRAFHERQWSPRAAALVLAGALEHLDRGRLADLLARIPDRPAPPAPPPAPPFRRGVEVEEHDGDTAQLRMAYEVCEVDLRRRRDRAIAEVYAQLIGGPMGSRLFDELREERALCYWIEGSVWGHEDRVVLAVQCSTGAEDLREAYERIDAIVTDLRERGPTEEESARAGIYAASAVALAFESSVERVEHALELLMEFGDAEVDPLLHLQAVEQVTHTDLVEVAAGVQPGPCIGCVGPVSAEVFGKEHGRATESPP
jgi:predicted Zn-dependent peptidase